MSTLDPWFIITNLPQHWKAPTHLPTDLPWDHPPPTPLLDEDLTEAELDTLEVTFTRFSVGKYFPNAVTNQVLEFHGDRYIASAVSWILQQEAPANFDSTALDTTVQILTTGDLLAVLALLYQFDKRIAAVSIGRNNLDQRFRQKDMNDGFEAFCAAVVQLRGFDCLHRWLRELYRPWLTPALEAGRLAMERRDTSLASHQTLPKASHRQEQPIYKYAGIQTTGPIINLDLYWAAPALPLKDRLQSPPGEALPVGNRVYRVINPSLE